MKTPFLALVLVTAAGLFGRQAFAVNPAWPNRAATAAELVNPANWPDDPSYGYPPGGSGGQWDMWSWIPPEALATVRPAEIPMGAGSHCDRAWQLSIGDPRVVIAVLDSGIEWDNLDLVNKFYLNTGELPLPEDTAGTPAATHDLDGDGVVTIRDWAQDPRVGDANANGLRDPGDLIAIFSDGVDDDGNGYADDISGWDFFRDDNDPYDDTRFGHGTGEARDSSAETNNGIGSAGYCPLCRVLMVRVGDSFVASGQEFAKGVVFAVDSGARVVQEALGTVDSSTFVVAALDYAYQNGALVVASAADENSFHHNLPGTNNHTLYVHAIREDTNEPQNATTFLNFNNCTNYGAQLQLSAPGESCSSKATGTTSGMAGLVYSYALEQGLTPSLSAEEARQLLVMTADDIYVPESATDPTKYPSKPGWDQRFGYGRNNIRTALDWVFAGKIPPEVDITSPTWFQMIPARGTATGAIFDITGRVAAGRASSFDYTIEVACGVEPEAADFTTLAAETNRTAPLGPILAASVTLDGCINPGSDAVNRHTITLRIRATAHYGGAIGDVPGEARRAFAIVTDPDLLAAFPLAIGGSAEASPKLADLDGDGAREIVIASSGGYVHALRASGAELPGFPFRTDFVPGLGPAPLNGVDYNGSAAYASGGVSTEGARQVVSATPAIGDLDGDGSPEIVVATFDGFVYAIQADGTTRTGFPVRVPHLTSAQTDPEHVWDDGIFASPALGDLDADGSLEIVVAAFDGSVHVWRADGTVQPGFPVALHYASSQPTQDEWNRLFGSPALGDLDGDGRLDIVAVSNERLRNGQAGAVYALYGDGNLHAGGPVHPNWPIVTQSIAVLPMVGEGVTSSPALVDLEGDGQDEVIVAGNGTPIFEFWRGVQPPRPVAGTPARAVSLPPNRFGSGTNVTTSSDNVFFSVFASGSIGDLDQDGVHDYVLGGAGPALLLNLLGGGTAQPFSHMLAAWSTQGGAGSGMGRMLPGFPRVMDDYQFFVNPAIADLDGDDYPEAISGSGGYWVRAFDHAGHEPAGWPKFTGQWLVSSPAVGDVDGDGLLEVVAATRSGFVYAWHTTGRTGGVIQWESFHHDNRNTGNYGVALGQGTLLVPRPPAVQATSGCGCRAAGRSSGLGAGWAIVVVAIGALVVRSTARSTARSTRRPRRGERK